MYLLSNTSSMRSLSNASFTEFSTADMRSSRLPCGSDASTTRGDESNADDIGQSTAGAIRLASAAMSTPTSCGIRPVAKRRFSIFSKLKVEAHRRRYWVVTADGRQTRIKLSAMAG